jgi:hypothetical protein
MVPCVGCLVLSRYGKRAHASATVRSHAGLVRCGEKMFGLDTLSKCDVAVHEVVHYVGFGLPTAGPPTWPLGPQLYDLAHEGDRL